jgi:non-canonical poly(A) RNA polymerase PAPD5/7
MPTRKESELREETITRLNLLVSQTFGGDRYITCHNFGSWQLQLALPGSDLDFVLMGGGGQAYNPLRKVASSLRNKRYASSMNVIENTRVPIIKYTDIKTDIDCDISFDMEGGILMGSCFSRILRERKMVHCRKLVMLIKYWLRSRGLHEPFNGGLGSYSVLVLVISHIQHNQQKNESLASLFRSFFEFYGTKFNFLTTGISLLNGGEYFSKEARGGAFSPAEQTKPALEDPCDPKNNISQASFQMPKIRDAFGQTSRRLEKQYGSDSQDENFGILNEIFFRPHSGRIK